MTRFSKKIAGVIVLGVFLLAAFIFVGWGSEGFRQWNTAKWFNYWWQGKPATVCVAEPPVDQCAIALTSADDDPELILDSEDGVTTLETTKLTTPVLRISTATLMVTVNGTLGQRVNLYCTYWSDTSYPTTFVFRSIPASDFKAINAPLSLLSLMDDLRAKSNDSSYFCPQLGVSCFAFFAQNVGDNYISSDYSSKLYVSYIPTPLSAKFEDGRFSVSGPEKYVSIPDTCNFRVFPYDSNDPVITINRPLSNVSSDDDTVNAYYDDTAWSVSLLDVANKLSTQPLADAYRISFAYKSFTYNFGIDQVYTFYPVVASRTSPYVSSVYKNFTVTRLATPTNFNFTDGTLTWDSVTGATQYGVFWTEGDIEKKAFVDEPSYTFDIEALGEGEHTVRVRALGNLAQTALENGQAMSITAYNAANVISQVVALTYNIDGDVVTKFVPYGSKLSDYIYDVQISGREFGGWFYDSGFSRKVADNDVLNGDITIYARLSDKKVTERPLTWWEQYMWYVLGPAIGLAALGILAGVVVGIRKKKAA